MSELSADGRIVDQGFGYIADDKLARVISAYQTESVPEISQTVNDVLDYGFVIRELDNIESSSVSYNASLSFFTAGLVLTGKFQSQILGLFAGMSEGQLPSRLTESALRSIVAEKVAFAIVVRLGSNLVSGSQLSRTIQAVAKSMANHSFGSTTDLDFAQSAADEVVACGSELIVAQLIKRTLEGYQIKHRDKRELEWLSGENDALFESMRLLQKYQLKPALVRSSGAGTISDWMVLDWESMQQQMQRAGEGYDSNDFTPQEILARIYGTTLEFIASEPVYERLPYSIKMDFSKAIKGAHSSNPDVAIQLDKNGKLTGMRGTSIEEFANQLGLSEQYQLLRGDILSLYCDLVLPAFMVREAQEIEKNVGKTGLNKSRDVDTIRKLVVARTRLLTQDTDRVKRELAHEYRKRPDEHPVIGFIRKLPKGFRATFEAREMCRRYLDKELPEEGETFVVPHDRGGRKDGQAEDSNKGHRAVRRNVGGAIVQFASPPQQISGK